jgi:AcrR family transcriptional regulator
LPRALKPELKPRKSPVQARSSASVEALREATIQVLLAVGKERLTTTRVAQRAGVSVGTLYQYFPNKSSLLQAALRHHLDQVYSAVEQACASTRGAPLLQMADALVDAFLNAKMKRAETSRVLYLVSDDIGGAEIAFAQSSRAANAISAMLESSPAKLNEDPRIVAATLIAAMSGVSRRIIENNPTSKTAAAMRRELGVMIRAYLAANSAPHS